MTTLRIKALLGAGCMSLAMIGSANAGGFSRGSADTDILFEQGNFNMRSSVTYVTPTRKFNKNGNPKLVGTDYAEDYVIPSAAVKFNLTENLRCAGTLVNNNGGNAKYDFPTLSGKISEEFTTYESALTCGVGFDVGQGKLWVLGGGFMEKFDYNRVNSYAALGLGNATLNLKGQEYGYRIGAAYEIPDIALRGQVMYRSGTKYGADGGLTAPAAVLAQATAGSPLQARFLQIIQQAGPNAQVPVDAIGVGNLPQSVEFKLQTGVAPGWLAFGSVKWTDWSQLTTLDVRSKIGGVTISSDKYFWKDGWTVTGGVGHAFNDSVSGFASLTWDQGVGTGWDVIGDTYTLAVGGSYKDGIGGEFRGGIGFSYLGSGEETKYAPGTNQGVKSGYAIAFNGGYSIKW
jgi:long-chain fatty acid transport protein